MTSEQLRERLIKTGLSQMEIAFKAGIKYPTFNRFMKEGSKHLTKKNHELVEKYIIQNHFTDLEKVEYSAREIERVLELVGNVWLKKDGEVFVCNEAGEKEIIQLPW